MHVGKKRKKVGNFNAQAEKHKNITFPIPSLSLYEKIHIGGNHKKNNLSSMNYDPGINVKTRSMLIKVKAKHENL